MQRLLSTVAAVLLVLSLASAAKAQVTLQPKHHEGTFHTVSSTKIHQILTIAGMDVETNVDVSTTMGYTVEKPQPDGAVRIQVKTEAMVAHITFPGAKVDYDSNKPD